MRLLALVELLALDTVLVVLLALITHNYALRNAYWGPEGFTPATTRYPLLFITSAVKGSTYIPGILSVDWQQVLILILVVTNAFFVWSAMKGRRSR